MLIVISSVSRRALVPSRIRSAAVIRGNLGRLERRRRLCHRLLRLDTPLFLAVPVSHDGRCSMSSSLPDDPKIRTCPRPSPNLLQAPYTILIRALNWLALDSSAVLRDEAKCHILAAIQLCLPTQLDHNLPHELPTAILAKH